MLTEVKNHLRLLLTSLKYNIIKAMDNRVAFISQVLGMMLNNGLMIIQWVVMFSIKDNIAGYGFKDILLLWAFTSSTYGIAHLLFENAFDLSRFIIGGKLDAFLVQPKNTLIYMATSTTTISAIGDLLYGVVLLIIIKSSFTTWMLFLLFTITGGIIMAAFSVIVHSLTFFMGNMSDFADIMNSSIINFSSYPNGIFSRQLKWVFMTIIPVSFIIHIPLSIVQSFSIYSFLGVIVFAIIITSIAFIIFNKGLKKYSSSNLMSARI